MKRSLNAFVSPLLKSDSRSFSVFVFCMSESKMGCSKVYHSLDVIFYLIMEANVGKNAN